VSTSEAKYQRKKTELAEGIPTSAQEETKRAKKGTSYTQEPGIGCVLYIRRTNKNREKNHGIERRTKNRGEEHATMKKGTEVIRGREMKTKISDRSPQMRGPIEKRKKNNKANANRRIKRKGKGWAFGEKSQGS